MPTPKSTSSAAIMVARAAASGPDLSVECLVRSVSAPIIGPPTWPRHVARSLRERLDFDIPSPRVAVSDRDSSVVRLVWVPIREQDLWEVIKLLCEALEYHILALARISIEVDLR
jgi:hypothetical protein